MKGGGMFGKNGDAASSERYGQSVLQEGVAVQGELHAKGDLRIDGEATGRLTIGEKLTIGVSGNVRADVEAGEIVVMGTVQGTVRARQRLELRKGARLVGDITSPILVIEEGVYFQGRSNMQAEDRAAEGLAEIFADRLRESERLSGTQA
jgi:cytoskeletal protein CcmA (bactofilin family)